MVLPRGLNVLLALAAALLAAALALALAASSASAAPADAGLLVQSVETSGYPLVGVRVSLPLEMLGDAAAPPRFTVTENGKAVSCSAKSLAGSADPLAAVLVVDVSGSMRGRPLEDGKAAAKRFVGMMGPEDEVALVVFSTGPRLACPFTSDTSRLTAAIDSLVASGETAVYDALVMSAEAFEGMSGVRKDIVVLSDGGDTMSTNSLDSAVKALKTRSIPVYAIALSSPEADFRALGTIAKDSGGRFLQVAESGQLASLYAGIAKQLQSQYEVSFRSAKPETTDLEIGLTASASGKESSALVVVDNPAAHVIDTSDLAPLPREDPTPAPLRVAMLAWFASVAFAAAGLFSYGLLLTFRPEKASLEQLAFYDQIRRHLGEGSAGPEDVREKVLTLVGAIAGKRGFTKLVHDKLERAALPLRPAEFIFLHLVGVVGLGVLTQLFGGSMLSSAVIVALATLLPLLVLDVLGQRRRAKFEEQLPDLLNLIAGSLRAGYGLLQAVGLVVEEMMPPASAEFKRVQVEARLGLSVEEALGKMAARLGSEEFRWTVMAIAIQREVGGNLAEILDIVATTIRDRDALKRHITALTEESRFSAIILTLLPFVVAGAVLFMSPGYMTPFFTDPLGMMLAVVGLVALVVGGLWLKKAMTIEV